MNILSNEFLRTILTMTISGSVVTLLLLLFKPLFRHRLPKLAQYGMWLVALAAFIIPISLFFTLPSRVANVVPIQGIFTMNTAVQNMTVLPAEVGNNPVVAPNQTTPYLQANTGQPAPLTPVHTAPVETIHNAAASADSAQITWLLFFTTWFGLIYPILVGTVLLYGLAGYLHFIYKLKSTAISSNQYERGVLSALVDGKFSPGLIVSNYATTPMLVGIIRPTIVLPNEQYTAEQLQSIFLHELTHMRRFDVVIKWLALSACAIHWFNPLVWIARRELDRACELSCDEATIRNMDARSKQQYGNTLIAVASAQRVPLRVLTTTMCAEKRAVKDRLFGIMKGGTYTRFAMLVSAFVILLAVLVACVTGAGGEGVRGADNDYNDAYPYDGNIGTDDPFDTENIGNQHTVDAFAQMYMQRHIDDLQVWRADAEATMPPEITDTRVNQLQRVATFENITFVLDSGTDHNNRSSAELWRFDFMVQTSDLEDEDTRWGTFSPDADGWIGHHTGWNDARVLLVYVPHAEGQGSWFSIPWFYELMVPTDTTWGYEMALRQFFTNQNMLSPVIFPGNHSFVYFDLGGMEYGRLLMSEFETSNGTIWIPERWQQIGNNRDFLRAPEDFLTEFTMPLNMDFMQTFEEQARRLVGRFESGEMAWLSNAEASARQFLNSWGLMEENARIVAEYRIDALQNPLTLAPHIFDSADFGVFSTDGGFFDWDIPDTAHEISIEREGNHLHAYFGYGGRVSMDLQVPMHLNFFGGGFPVGGLFHELIEGYAVFTQDSIRVMMLVSRNAIISERTRGPLGTLVGPGVEFEWIPGFGIHPGTWTPDGGFVASGDGVHVIPFEFLEEGFTHYEPLTVAFEDETLIEFAELMRTVMGLFSEYLNN